MTAVALALACRDEHEPTATGDRVELTTEVVPKVCRGTIEYIDDEMLRIEDELALAPASEPIELHVVDEQHIGEYCGSSYLCVLQPPRRLYITPQLYDRHLRFELVRDRLSRGSVSASKPLFYEGIAGALTWPSCEPSELVEIPGLEWTWQPPSVDTLLGASSRGYLRDEGRYLGGELVRWLLDTRGPEQLLAFMAPLGRHDSPDEVRVAYLEWTGGSIDSDLYAHWRSDDAPVDPGRAGCTAPAAPLGDAPSRIRLAAEFDCDSPRVRNDFEDPSRVFVEWTIDVPADRDGVWSLLDALPEGVTLEIWDCQCTTEAWSVFASPPNEQWPSYDDRWLDAERYRVRMYAPIGATVDIQLQAPCDFVAQDCPTGQQCTQGGDCLPQVDDPAQLGDPCWPAFGYDESPLPCAVGLTCIGPAGGDGVCLPVCDDSGEDATCPGELTCFDGLACTEACDPFTSMCGDGWHCIPDFGTGNGGCIPSTSELGVLEPCDLFDFSCGPGLVCENIPELEGCHDPEAWIDFSGCCTPLCDPAAVEPSCPPELPNCEPEGEAGLGTCVPA
jgi:hypothetical protein